MKAFRICRHVPAILAGLVVVASCCAANSQEVKDTSQEVKVQIHDDGKQFVVKADLGTVFWPKNGNGKALLDVTSDPEDPKIVPEEVPYTIKDYHFTALIPYRKPTKPEKVTIKLHNIKDKNDSVAGVFVGDPIDLKAAQPQQPASTKSAKPASTADSKPAQPSQAKAQTQQQQPQPPREQARISEEDDHLEIAADLKGQVWPNYETGMATIEGSPNADGSPIIRQTTVPYEVSKNRLTAKVPFERPKSRSAMVTIRLSKLRSLESDREIIIEGQIFLKSVQEIATIQKQIASQNGDEHSFHSLVYLDTALLMIGFCAVAGSLIWRFLQPAESWRDWMDAKIQRLEADVKSVRGIARELQGATQRRQEWIVPNAPLPAKEDKPVQPTLTAAEIHSLVQDSIRARLGSDEDWENLLRRLQIERKTPPAVQKFGLERQESRVAAVVNRWLSTGGHEIRELLRLAEGLGLQAALASHKDVDRVFGELTNFEYPFECMDDGPWLWAPIAGTNDVFAAPADAAFFGMGSAPALLNRLFDGMKNAPQGFRFQTIYKPCRLRRVGGQSSSYTLVTKGLLQLEGLAAPNATRPEGYESLIPSTSRKTPLLPSEPSVLTAMSAWVANASAASESLSKDYADVVAALMELQQRMDRNDSRFDDLLQAINQQIESLERSVRRRTTVLGRDSNITAAQPDSLRNDGQEKPPSAPPPVVTPESASETSGKGDRPVSSPAAQAPASRMSSPSENVTSTSPKVTNRLSKGWQDALVDAANQPDSEPGMVEVPKPALYVQRVGNAARALRRLDSGLQVAVVHLKLQGDERFEIHETDAGFENNAELVCTSCNTGLTGQLAWQLGVCVGENGASDISILFPLGSLYKGHYSSGYSSLIDSLPSSSFSIGRVDHPADLHLADKSARVYVVTRKMSWSKPMQAVGVEV